MSIETITPSAASQDLAGSSPTHRAREILTLSDVAALLQCSKAHVSNLINGKIPGVPKLAHFALGRRKVVRREWLEEWIEANKCQ